MLRIVRNLRSEEEKPESAPASADPSLIERTVRLLEHARQCLDGQCRYQYCAKMRILMNHSEECPKQNCVVCEQILAVYAQHAQGCGDYGCEARYCRGFKTAFENDRIQRMELCSELETP